MSKPEYHDEYHPAGSCDACAELPATIQHITPEIAHQVLWHYGRASEGFGYPPGGFTRELLFVIAKADSSNRSRLALGFPGHVQACVLIERAANGALLLRNIARKGQENHDA